MNIFKSKSDNDKQAFYGSRVRGENRQLLGCQGQPGTEGVCEVGLGILWPTLQPVVLCRCVQRKKRPVFAQREIIYTWIR